MGDHSHGDSGRASLIEVDNPLPTDLGKERKNFSPSQEGRIHPFDHLLRRRQHGEGHKSQTGPRRLRTRGIGNYPD